MSQVDSFDVLVRTGEDRAGEDVFETVAHFMEERNALSYAQQLEAQGDTVHVQKSALYDASETQKEEWFLDYLPQDY